MLIRSQDGKGIVLSGHIIAYEAIEISNAWSIRAYTATGADWWTIATYKTEQQARFMISRIQDSILQNADFLEMLEDEA